jgi:hypothetical protein
MCRTGDYDNLSTLVDFNARNVHTSSGHGLYCPGHISLPECRGRAHFSASLLLSGTSAAPPY